MLPPSTKEFNEGPTTIIPKIKTLVVVPESDKVKNPNNHNKESFIFRKDIIWSYAITIFALYGITIYGFLTIPYIQKWKTVLWAFIFASASGIGVTAGIHRYWTHKSYKANTPLKIILAILYLSAGQLPFYQWVRDHRVHHKFSDTDADPHNSKRGFFFSHIGWLMLKRHPDVIKQGKLIDISDIKADPVASFCDKHFKLLRLILSFAVPMVIPVILWNEEWYWTILINITRFMYLINVTAMVNSFAHFFGNKPYNKNIVPVESKIAIYFTYGEGWHNYHHTFPTDYRASEIGGGRMNITTNVIDLFAKIGWAYDRKMPSDELVRMTIANRGDGTHESEH